LEDPGIGEKIILISSFRKWDVVVMDWIALVHEKYKWRAFVNVVMNLRVP
jgi:hypothetical protein